MPVDRELASDLVSQIVDLYAAVEADLVADLRRRFTDDVEAPEWAVRQLSAVSAVRRHAIVVLGQLDRDLDGTVTHVLSQAYARGGAEAAREIARQAGASAAEIFQLEADLPQLGDVQTLVLALTNVLRNMHVRIVRWVADAFRTVVGRAAATVLSGAQTRRQAAQAAFDRLLGQGITGFSDSAGRNWELQSYVEMATRTTTAQAAVQGHLDQLTGEGYDLVIVSDSPGECARCRPWEGRVLTIGGAVGPSRIQRENRLTGKRVTFAVAGSVSAAVAAGLMHPNCRHSLSGYLPGVTQTPINTADPEGDVARQRLRTLERRKRSLLRRKSGALTKAHERRLAGRVREVNDLIKAHVSDTGLIRQPARERIGTAR